jgi:hypothetical protein
MDQRYPWSLLGIEPTGDEKAIRKAYAQKLKETRPDEDAAGFQALLKARDLALRQIRNIPSGRDSDQKAADVEINIAPKSFVANANSSASSPQDEDILGRFQALLRASRAHAEPERLKIFWMEVLTARDQAPLAFSGLLTSMMLMRLVEDMYEHFGTLPDISIRPGDAKFIGTDFLMPYAPVLRMLEQRFGFLGQDRMLFGSLDAGRARYLLAALTLAIGRPPADMSKPTPYYEVSLIDDIYLDLVFPKDPEIQDYYRIAHQRDRHPRSGSILGALFPLPVALYYRLYGFAAVVAVLLSGQAVGLLLWRKGLVPEFHWIFLWLYLFFVVPVGLVTIRRMRVEAAARKIRRLSKKHDLVTIKEKLEAWGRPDWISMWIGIVVLLVMQASAAYDGRPAFTHDRPPTYGQFPRDGQDGVDLLYKQAIEASGHGNVFAPHSP